MNKRNWGHLLVLIALLSGSDGAVAAISAAGAGPAHVTLNTGSGVALLHSVSGLGFSSKGAAASKRAGAGAMPTPVDVSVTLDPKSPVFGNVLDYVSGKRATLEASVQLADQNYSVRESFNLGTASISELEFAAADARSSKTRSTFRVRLQPQTLTLTKGSGKLDVATNAKAANVLSSNFRVSLGGAATPEVLAVSQFVVRRAGAALQIEGLSIDASYAQAIQGAWWKWAESALSGGKVEEKTVVVEYLDPTLKNTLLSFEFTGVGLEGVQLSQLTSGSGPASAIHFELSARDLRIK